MWKNRFEKELVDVQDDLYKFAFRLTANRDDAYDLLQDASLRALDNEEKFAPETNFKGWMYTIMRNIFINNYRKVVREQTFFDNSEKDYYLHVSSVEQVEDTESVCEMRDLHRIVNKLPGDLSRPFNMLMAGFKYREIADHLSVPIGTVKSRIFFIRQRLQQDFYDAYTT